MTQTGCGPVTSTPAHRSPVIPGAELVWEPTDVQLGVVVKDAHVDNVDVGFSWPGEIDVEALRGAVDRLIQRHGILRSRYFQDEAGKFWVITEPRMHVPLHVIDLTRMSEGERQRAASEARMAVMRERFDMYKGPLIRIALIRLTPADSLLTAAAHHSIFDGVSCGILAAELRALYRNGVLGDRAPAPPAPLQYCDFAREQHEWKESAAIEPHVAYWRNRLAGARHMFWLPVDRLGPPDPSAAPAIRGSLGGDTFIRLREMSQRHECTLFPAVCAAFSTVLARWSGLDDITFWVSSLGRSRPEMLGVLGCFVNYWMMRMRPSPDDRMVDVLRHARDAYVESLPHSHITNRTLQPDLHRIREGKRNPAIFLNYMADSRTGGQRSSGMLEPLQRFARSDGATVMVALNAHIIVSDSSVEWYFVYARQLFEQQTVERASACFQRLLAAIADSPDERVADCRLGEILPPERLATLRP